MKASFATAFVGLMASALPAAATPVPAEGEIEERQFLDIFLFSIIQSSASGALAQFLGPELPGCSFDDSSHDNWWTRAYHVGEDGKNHTVAEVCWSGGTYDISPADSIAVNCLMDLHAKQETTCIDVEGSPCGGNPRIGVGNARNIYDWNTKNNQKIAQTSANIAKKAFSKMMHNEKGWDTTTYMDIMPMNDDGTYTSWSIQIRGTGASDC